MRTNLMNYVVVEPEMNVSYNVSKVAVIQFQDKCREAVTRCSALRQDETADISHLFDKRNKILSAKPSKHNATNFSINLSTVFREETLSGESSPSQKNAKNKTLSINLVDVFKDEPLSENGSAETERRRLKLEKDKMLRSPNRRPVFKQNL